MAMKMDGGEVSSGRSTRGKAINLLDVLKVVSDLNEIRGLVLVSLFLQIILALYGRKRQRSKSGFLNFILWSAYLMADAVAISALSLIAAHNFQPYVETVNIAAAHKSQPYSQPCDQDSGSRLPIFVAFWSPFLLLHLGGPDAMTSLSLEDNKLWWRHFLGLMVHTGMAAFILIRPFFSNQLHHHQFLSLLSLSIPVFLAGFLKYFERTMALMSASFPQMRYSDIMFQDPSIHDYKSRVAQYWPASLPLHEQRYKMIFEAHYLFPIFRRVFLNLSIDHNSHNIGKLLFKDRDWKEVFKVIELELQIMFETLYTKAFPKRATTRFILKIISFSCIFPVFIVFLCHYGRAQYDQRIRTDIAITYILLGGAIVLEMYQGILMLLNDWTIMMVMKRKSKLGILHTLVLKYLPSSRLNLLYEPPRWSNSMGQCNLVSICLHSSDVKPASQRHTRVYRMKGMLWVRDMLAKFWRIVITHKPIDGELKELILKHLWGRVRSWEAQEKRIKNLVQIQTMDISTEDLFRRFLNRWGDWVLEELKCHKKYGWTTRLDIDHSILLWHIATDICYYQSFGESSFGESSTSSSSLSSSSTSNDQYIIKCSLSKGLSDHLMYLLLKHSAVVTSKLIPDKRFKEICEALRKELIRDPRQSIKNESEACGKLYGNEYEHHTCQKHVDLKDPSYMIQAASSLAKGLMSENREKRWKIIIGLWLEMLVYVANQCPGDRHAARLTHGGALITHVWLLLTHLGISTPCEPVPPVETEGWISGLWSWCTGEFCC